MQEIEDVDRRKAFAVAVLSEVWAGAELPSSMIEHAEQIRSSMIKEGIWASA